MPGGPLSHLTLQRDGLLSTQNQGPFSKVSHLPNELKQEECYGKQNVQRVGGRESKVNSLNGKRLSELRVYRY